MSDGCLGGSDGIGGGPQGHPGGVWEGVCNRCLGGSGVGVGVAVGVSGGYLMGVQGVSHEVSSGYFGGGGV